MSTGCKDKAKTGGAADLDARCEQMAKACGDNDKHIEKLIEECKDTAKKQVEKGCADKAIAVYDCYQKEACGKGDRVWALEDLRVLADRQKQCVAERDALGQCVGK